MMTAKLRGRVYGGRSHQIRRIAPDPATVEVLTDHRARYEAIVCALDWN